MLLFKLQRQKQQKTSDRSSDNYTQQRLSHAMMMWQLQY